MDSRENPQPPPRQLPNMMVGPGSYPTTTASHHMINPNSSPSTMMHPRFNFNSVVGLPPSSEPLDTMAAVTSIYDGSSQSGFSIEPVKKKRGRPRKYAPEGNIALGLGPSSAPPSSGGHAFVTSSPPSEPQSKKHRGRPPGSGKKQLDALGAGGVGFTPHVILVKAGEDVASKIEAFSKQGPRAVCILSANGAVCSVTLKQPAMSGAPISYEGRFEIISLSGSFLEGDSGENSGLSVSLAGSDGRVLGGGVAGMLIAASPVQVIVGSFVTNGKKPTKSTTKPAPHSALQPQTLTFGAQPVAASNHPPSQEPSSQSSEDDGGSPENRPPEGGGGGGGGYYNDMGQTHQHQPLPNNIPMYHHPHHHLWASQGHR